MAAWRRSGTCACSARKTARPPRWYSRPPTEAATRVPVIALKPSAEGSARPHSSGPSLNTVDLRGQHDDLPRCGGAVMVWAFDRPVAHLAFDDAGIGSFSPLGQGAFEDLVEGALVRLNLLRGGKSPCWHGRFGARL